MTATVVENVKEAEDKALSDVGIRSPCIARDAGLKLP